LRLFELLDSAAASHVDIATHLDLPDRSVEILLTALAALKLIEEHHGRFHLTDLAKTYLLPSSQFYWVPMLGGAGNGQLLTNQLLQVLRTEHLGEDDRITRRWERGEMPAADAKLSNRRMHSHSFPSALGLAQAVNFSKVRRLLDIAGGSGC